jgi:hypothetical protein
MNEADWQLFARSTAVHGIASTLSMPIRENGEGRRGEPTSTPAR